MRRGFHLAIALVAIALLIRPLDCFASGTFDRQVADCCAKGDCHPSAASDPCCQGTVPAANHFVAGKAVDHSSPLAASVSTGVPTLAPAQSIEAPSIAVSHPPPLGVANPSRPLLI